MVSIYDQHDKAFQHVSAFVIVKNGERVASIAIKFPKDGASRLYAYVHWLGLAMVRGHANGYGYDKRSAACANAARLMPDIPGDSDYDIFRDTLKTDSGECWDNALRNAGFEVWQAV